MIEDQAVRIEVTAAKLAGRGIIDVMQMVAQSLHGRQYGQQSIAQLNKQEKQLTSFEVDNSTIRAAKRQLKAYSVDFSITKDKDTGQMYVWYKGQDVERVEQALKNCIKDLGKEEENPTPSLEELQEKTAALAEELNRDGAQKNVPVPEIGERT